MPKSTEISQQRRQYLRQQKVRRVSIFSTQIAVLLIFFGLWEVAANLDWIDAFITSQPSRMWKTVLNMHSTGELYLHVWTTVWETIVGFTTGTIGGLAIAIMLWWSPFLCRVADPYLVVLNALPKVALGPILIVWLGNGQPAIIVMALLISIIVTIISMLQGFLSVDQDKIKLIQAFGANKMTILTKVVLPASLPNMISALKVNVGLSWVGVIMGEFLVSQAGLGHLIVYGGQVFQLDIVMTSVIILALCAALMYVAVAYAESKLLRWRL